MPVVRERDCELHRRSEYTRANNPAVPRLWQYGGNGASRKEDQRSAAPEDGRATTASAAPPFAATSRAIRESVRKSSRSMFSILIRKPKRCSSSKSSSTNWNESRMPVSRRSVSGEGTSMWKLSTNSVPRRSMMAFASVKFASFLVSYVRRARLAIHPADVRGRRRFHPRLHRARFDAAEALPQPGTVDLAIVILGQG